MNVLEFSALIGFGSLLAGFLGALTGLGGGVVIVPLLTLLFHVDIRYAIGASLVSVIATSSGAAAAYVREGYSNIRIGMFLETATTVGALVGAAIAMHVSGNAIAIVFGWCCCIRRFSPAATGSSMALTCLRQSWRRRLRLERLVSHSRGDAVLQCQRCAARATA